MDGYRTVAGLAHDEFTEQKSRFLGSIAPASTQEEALAHIARVSALHRAAAHNVYAYRLQGGLERCSDHGEPQGTAGVPVLTVLQKEGLTDVCMVVTRYFGGVLLGSGGLVRAYSHAASLAVGAARIRRMEPCVRVCVSCDYSLYGRLVALLPVFGARLETSEFGAAVTLSLLVRADRLPGLQAALTEASNGRAGAEPLAILFAELPRGNSEQNSDSKE